MAEAWAHQQLGDFLTLQRGFDITRKEQRPGPYRVISSSGPSSHHDEARVEGPGVVIGRKGSLGGVYYSEIDFWPHDTTLWVKDFKGNDPLFTYYFLKTLGLERFDVGAANPTLNRNHLHLLPISAPSVATQHKIAAVLAAYDALVENNLRRIEILEEMAQAVYREWFVNFRFAGHERVGLVDSPLGPIPEGWEVVQMADFTTTQYGYTASTDDSPVGPKFLRGMDFNKRPWIDWSEVPYCPISDSDHVKYRVRIGDVLVIRMADPGKVAIVEKDVDAVFASYVVRVSPDQQRALPYWLFYYMSSPAYQAYISGAGTGTTRKSASAGVLTGSTMALPALDIQAQFADAVALLRRLLNNLINQNASLRATRDLLLPKLVSGGIDVSDLDIDTEWLAS